MDRPRLKGILRLYNNVLTVIGGLIVFFACIVICIVPASTAYRALEVGAILVMVGLLGVVSNTLKETGERMALISYTLGLGIVVIIQLCMIWSLMASHDEYTWNPLSFVTNLVAERFEKHLGFLVILLTVPQVIAIFMAVQILRTNPRK